MMRSVIFHLQAVTFTELWGICQQMGSRPSNRAADTSCTLDSSVKLQHRFHKRLCLYINKTECDHFLFLFVIYSINNKCTTVQRQYIECFTQSAWLIFVNMFILNVMPKGCSRKVGTEATKGWKTWLCNGNYCMGLAGTCIL